MQPQPGTTNTPEFHPGGEGEAMPHLSGDAVAGIRRFNRFYTNILGLTNRFLLESPFSLAEARVLFEIGHQERRTARDLSALLHLDPGYLSRMLSRFCRTGLVVRVPSPLDGRSTVLQLTPDGKNALEQLEAASDRQLETLLGHLSSREMHRLLLSMGTIEQLLGAGNAPEPHIRTFLPGDLSCIASRHARLYGEEYGFDATFEYYVMAGMASFLKDWSGCGDPRRKGKGNVWVVEQDGLLGGSIAVVETEEKTAQLRWFLLEPEYRGKGFGHRLMEKAMHFCASEGYERVFLWTVSDLLAARHLYEKWKFSLTETVEHHIWGKNLTEERWDKVL